MEHEVYSGVGSYSITSLNALYRVYLPVLPIGTYEFFTDRIYNLSCEAYPNTIMIFMRVKDGPNTDLSGYTDEPGTPFTFSLSDSHIMNIDPSCIPLDKKSEITVVMMHDNALDTIYAREHLYCVAPRENDGQEGVLVTGDAKLDTGVISGGQMRQKQATSEQITPRPLTAPKKSAYGPLIPKK